MLKKNLNEITHHKNVFATIFYCYLNMVKRPSKKTKSRDSEEEKGHKRMGYPECGACAELNTRMYIGKREWKGDYNQPTLNSRIIDLIDLWFRLTMTMRERALSVCEWGIRKAGYRMCDGRKLRLSRTSCNWIFTLFIRIREWLYCFHAQLIKYLHTLARIHLNACTHFIISAFVDWLDHITIHFISFYLW